MLDRYGNYVWDTQLTRVAGALNSVRNKHRSAKKGD
jgi:hypothetical protein